MITRQVELSYRRAVMTTIATCRHAFVWSTPRLNHPPPLHPGRFPPAPARTAAGSRPVVRRLWRDFSTALLSLPLLAMFAAGVQASALLSSLGQAGGSTGTLGNDHIQRFTTGDYANGYNPTGVEMEPTKLEASDVAGAA